MTRPWQETLSPGYTTEQQIEAMQKEIDQLWADVRYENSIHAKAIDEYNAVKTDLDAVRILEAQAQEEKRILSNSLTNRIMNLELELGAKRQEILNLTEQGNIQNRIDSNRAFLVEVYNKLVTEFDQNPTSEFMQKLQVIIS